MKNLTRALLLLTATLAVLGGCGRSGDTPVASAMASDGGSGSAGQFMRMPSGFPRFGAPWPDAYAVRSVAQTLHREHYSELPVADAASATGKALQSAAWNGAIGPFANAHAEGTFTREDGTLKFALSPDPSGKGTRIVVDVDLRLHEGDALPSDLEYPHGIDGPELGRAIEEGRQSTTFALHADTAAPALVAQYRQGGGAHAWNLSGESTAGDATTLDFAGREPGASLRATIRPAPDGHGTEVTEQVSQARYFGAPPPVPKPEVRWVLTLPAEFPADVELPPEATLERMSRTFGRSFDVMQNMHDLIGFHERTLQAAGWKRTDKTEQASGWMHVAFVNGHRHVDVMLHQKPEWPGSHEWVTTYCDFAMDQDPAPCKAFPDDIPIPAQRLRERRPEVEVKLGLRVERPLDPLVAWMQNALARNGWAKSQSDLREEDFQAQYGKDPDFTLHLDIRESKPGLCMIDLDWRQQGDHP